MLRYKLERKMAKKNEEQAQSSKRGRKPKIRPDLETANLVENEIKDSSSRLSRETKDSPRSNREEKGSSRPSRETKESPRSTREDKESPRRSRDIKESPKTTREDKGSPRLSREAKDSPRSYRETKDSPRSYREGKNSPRCQRETKDSPRSNKEEKGSPRPSREIKESSKSIRFEKLSPRRARDNKDISKSLEEEKRSQNITRDTKETHTVGNESPRLTRQAKESYQEEKEATKPTKSSKDCPVSHIVDHKISLSKDEINLSSKQTDLKDPLKQTRDDIDSTQDIKEGKEYNKVGEPKLLEEPKDCCQNLQKSELTKTSNQNKDSPITSPIPQNDKKQKNEKRKSPRNEQKDISIENEENYIEKYSEDISNLKEYSSEGIVLNEDELIVTNEIEVETIPENDSYVEDLSKAVNKDTPFAISDRPFRAAAATAQAISEAQQEFMSIEPPPEFKRNSKGKIEFLVDKPIKPRKYTKRAKLAGLEHITNDRMKDSYDEETASQGSYNQNLQETTLNEYQPREYELEEEIEESYVEKSLSYLLETIKNQYMGMIQSMQDPAFSKNIEQQIKKEKSRNEQLSKRVDQLESQIETLIQDSLGMLKSGLKELGIEATTPPEFIEKAKGIVCEHNELQKRRYCLEAEIKQLEEEQNKLLKNKESELFEQLLKQKSPHRVDLSESELMKVVQREIKECLEPAKPFTNKKLVSDVTLTRVEDNTSFQQQGCSDTCNDDTLVDKEFYSEKAAQDKYTLSKVGGKSKLSDHTSEQEDNRKQKLTTEDHIAVPRAEDYEVRVKNINTRELVDERNNGNKIANLNTDPKHTTMPVDTLTNATLDYNWNEAEMNLQNIRNNNDETHGLDMRRIPGNENLLRDRELTKEITNQNAKYDYKIYKKDSMPNSYPNDPCSVVDHINKEIERNMRAELVPVRAKDSHPRMNPNIHNDYKANLSLVKPGSVCDGIVKNLSAISADQFMSLSVEQALQSPQVLPCHTAAQQASVSRLTQVIEDSVRGSYPSNIPMEGLACPRNGNSPKFQMNSIPRNMDHEYRQGYPLKSSSSCSSTSSFPMSLMPNMEGLASRMETCFDKEMNSRRGDTPDVQNCSRPTSTGSKSSLHTPDPTLHLEQDDRKRVASPVDSPIIPSKKQHFDSEAKAKEPNSNKPKEKIDEARKWQDEISSGFDRLVALASEVDKRRRSIENSPGQPVTCIASSTEISSTNYDAQSQRLQENKIDTQIQDMQKFKYSEASYNLVTSIQNQFAMSSEANRQRNDFMNNTSTSTHAANLANPSSNQFVQCPTSKLSASGEKLPERHFKKKYFDQEYQKQQQQQLASVDKKVPSQGIAMPNCSNSTGQHSRPQKSPTRDYPNQNPNYANSAVLSHTTYNQNRPQLHHDQPIQQVHSGQHTHLGQPTHPGQPTHSGQLSNPSSQTHKGPPPPGHPAHGVQTTNSGHNVHPSHSTHPNQAMHPGHMTHPAQPTHSGEPIHSGQQPMHPSQLAHSTHPAHPSQTAQHSQHMQPSQQQNRGGPNIPKHTKYPTQKPIHPSEQHYYGDNYSRHSMYPPYPQGQMRQDQMSLPPGSQNPNYYGPHNYSRQGYPAHYRGRPGYIYQPPPHTSENMQAYRNSK
eukprot:GFUD01012449.1.p1 GENE.GFUD01012449.1~~GFUD01012449.1.p1  ORF type:complete len:1610 (-),score=395.77 GFUD01012449.1:789-5618(-)